MILNQRLTALDPARFETPVILKQLISASRCLAELKGLIDTIPQQEILISTLGIQEAKDSSEIENIVTTHDELYRDHASHDFGSNPATKEVANYRAALQIGFDLTKKTGLISTNHLVEIQQVLTGSNTGIRTLHGTHLKNGLGETVYTPPQDITEILDHMKDLETFINDPKAFPADPLIKMALIHHQFESIHPFYDGNGRTGRILNVLYLVKESLLNIPVLYLSRPIMRSKVEYYRLLQAVRDQDAWEDWVLYMLEAVELSATDAIITIENMRKLILETKHMIRENFKFYSQELINHLFSHPYTKIDLIVTALDVSRPTAAKYLEELTAAGILRKEKAGRDNYYVNSKLWAILAGI